MHIKVVRKGKNAIGLFYKHIEVKCNYVRSKLYQNVRLRKVNFVRKETAIKTLKIRPTLKKMKYKPTG